MDEIPWSPAYRVTVADDDSRSFETNSAVVTIQTRVPQEALADNVFRNVLAGIGKEITDGRS
ncbi:hypothetical protein PBI_MALINSILVA_47 [Mycobacterium phage Malinsilva]|uniref:Uncharacterized protein n=1 Tax=Mycobacterium phage Malinsilva TaxID=1821720 RepID=A0A142K6C5_9CAUD|nr:hypothetical protein PBI_MALINSILVA_47 [Mycobacterium phage Malinsilva]